jgi:hypothetical protein
MELYFLQAADDTPLCKIFTQVGDQIEKQSYPNVFEVNSFSLPVTTPAEMHMALVANANRGHCLLKGPLKKQLRGESRAGQTHLTAETQYLCLDIDGLNGVNSPEDFVTRVLPAEFQSVSYVAQLSSSAGMGALDGFHGHLFFMLSQPITPDMAKAWIKQLNLDNELLNKNLELSRNNIVLKWKLDVSVNQNDKLIYIADPVCNGFEDPLAGNRIRLVAKDRNTVQLNTSTLNAGQQAEREMAKINELRKELGLPKKQAKYREAGGVSYLVNPDPMVMCAQPFTQRGFTYTPINPDNLTKYWHPIDDPTFIFSFGGEPPMLTADVFPEYWAGVKSQARTRARTAPTSFETGEENQPLTTLLFRSYEHDAYFEAHWNEHEIKTMYALGSKDKVMDRYKELDQAPPEFIPSWHLAYDPQNDQVANTTTRTLNRFRKSEFMQSAAKLHEVPDVPPTINWILQSAFAADAESIEHFLNWLAVKFQTRKKCGTAWVLQGTFGTGKGILYHQIIKPLMGDENATMRNVEHIIEQFNGYLETSLIVAVDEIVMNDHSAATSQALEKIKSWITEPTITIREMRRNQREAKSYCDFIFFSNDPAPIRISSGDRRFNVSPRQEHSIRHEWIQAEHGEQLKDELHSFANYLMTREACPQKASTVLYNAARAASIENTKTALELFGDALKGGNLEYFVSEILRDQEDSQPILLAGAKTVLTTWARRIRSGAALADKVTTEELRKVYSYLTGQSHHSKIKFAKMLSHQGITNHAIRVEDARVARGIEVSWQPNDLLVQEVLNNGNRPGVTHNAPPTADTRASE